VNQMWILKNSKDLLEYIQSRSLSSCNSITTFDFSTLYTTIHHSNLKDRLRELVQLCFIKKNGQRRYKYLVLGRDRSYFVKHHSDSTKKFSETDTINRVISVRKDNPPWLTSSIKRGIRRKNRLHKRAKRSNLPGHWERFRIARNKCKNLVSNAKIAHYSKVSENIRLEKAGSKNWWTLVQSLTGSNDWSRTIPPIEHNGNRVYDDIEKSELLTSSSVNNQHWTIVTTHLPT
jgi:hypothetical protein